MLSRFFGSKPERTGSNVNSRVKNDTVQLKRGENRELEINALKGSERQLYQFHKPIQQLGMTDLIKQHEPGTRFMYAAVTGAEDEDADSRLAKLRGWKPNYGKKMKALDRLPLLKLYQESTSFPLEPIIRSLIDRPVSRKGSKTTEGLGEFFRVAEACVIYGAIVSPDCNFTKVRVSMMDERLLANKLSKGFIANSNLETRGDLRVPYCIPVENVDKISLVVSRDNQFIEDGLMWGVIQIKLSIEFTHFPQQYDNLDVMATTMTVGTNLGTRITDPDIIDLTVTEDNRRELTRLFQSEDLVDMNEPVVAQKILKTAKSSVRQLARGDTKPEVEGWGSMTIPRSGVVEASIDPDEDESDTESDVRRRQEAIKIMKMNMENMRAKHEFPIATVDSIKDDNSITARSDSSASTKKQSPPGKKRAKFEDDDSLNLFD